jgi:hypothetical protein
MSKNKIFITVLALCAFSLVNMHDVHGLARFLSEAAKVEIGNKDLANPKKFENACEKLKSLPSVNNVEKVENYPVVVIELKTAKQPDVWRCGYYSVVFYFKVFKEIINLKWKSGSGVQKKVRKLLEFLLNGEEVRLKVDRLIKAMGRGEGDEGKLFDTDIVNMLNFPKLVNKILEGSELKSKDQERWNKKIRDAEFASDPRQKISKASNFVTVTDFFLDKGEFKPSDESMLNNANIRKNIEDLNSEQFLLLLGHKQSSEKPTVFVGSHFINALVEQHKGVKFIIYADSLGRKISDYLKLFKGIAPLISDYQEEDFPEEEEEGEEEEGEFPPEEEEEGEEEDFPEE